jgi:hypothetical protein
MRWSGPWNIEGRVWPRHEQRGRPLNAIVRRHSKMIANRDIAKEIVTVMLEAGARIDASVALVQERGTPEDLAHYRRAAGAVMAEILLGVLNPIFEQHPELKPPELKG